MSTEIGKVPNFEDQEEFWLLVWRSVNFSWERHWKARPEPNTEFAAWWVGHHAGLMFRLREISGLAYKNGQLVSGK